MTVSTRTLHPSKSRSTRRLLSSRSKTSTRTGLTYKVSGVDVEAGDSFSNFCATVCRGSYNNSPRHIKVTDLSKGNFRGPRGWQYQGMPAQFILTTAPDGIGTKVILIVAAGDYLGAAINLIAMTADDIACWGGLPTVFSNVLDAKSVGNPGTRQFMAYQKMMTGLGKVAKKQKLVLLNGETAELWDCITSENPQAKVQFNWGGVMNGVYDPNRMILGDKLRCGQVVIALRDGFRSNGISLVRRCLAREFGKQWYKNPKAKQAIKEAAKPAMIYAFFLATLNGWYDPEFKPDPNVTIALAAHLSGGSIKGKFAEMLFRHGFSADLLNLWAPPAIMRKCAKWGAVSDEECYSSWNGGQGMLLVVEPGQAKYLIHLAKKFGIEARVCGVIKKTRGSQAHRVKIRSKFTGKTFCFKAKKK